MEHDRRLAVAVVTMLLVLTVLICVGVGFHWFDSRLYAVGMGLAGGLSFAFGYRILYRLLR